MAVTVVRRDMPQLSSSLLIWRVVVKFLHALSVTPYASKQTLLKHQQSQHSAAYKAAKQILASASSNQLSSTDQANGDGKINNTVGSTAHQPIR